MAKTIQIATAGKNTPLANGGLKLSKIMKIEDIEEHPQFKILYPINQELLDRITASITDGYDGSQPVHIWLCEENGVVHKYLVDGYTRVKAAKNAGLLTIPVYEHKFTNFEEAYKYVLGLQVNRRNLDSADLLRNVKKLLGTDFIQNIEGSKAEAIAESLDVSARTVQRAISVEKNATDEQKQRIDSGEATVNEIYKELHPKKNSEQDSEQSSKVEEEQTDDDEISESLSDSSGNIAPLGNFEHSDGIERPYRPPYAEDETDIFLREKNIQIETAEKKGFADGFEKALTFVLGEILKGRTPEEIYNDERLADLSPSVIFNFEVPEEDEELVSKL